MGKKISNGLKLREQAIMYSFLAFVYVVLVGLLMNNGSKLFGENDNVGAPAVLLLLVLSVAVMGILIFGKAMLMYLDGEKKDAVKLVIYNIICLFTITIFYLGTLFIINKCLK